MLVDPTNICWCPDPLTSKLRLGVIADPSSTNTLPADVMRSASNAVLPDSNWIVKSFWPAPVLIEESWAVPGLLLPAVNLNAE